MNMTLRLRREELEGFIGLDMPREALKLAGRLLRLKRIGVPVFQSCVDAILICADSLGRWERRVEKAYDRLTPQGKEAVKGLMFNFFVSLDKWHDAERFMPKKPVTAQEMVFTMWTLLHLRRMEEAEKLNRLCLRMFVKAGCEFDASCIMEAMACYSAQSGAWEDAEFLLNEGTELRPFSDNAWDKLVKLHALRGLLVANEVFENARTYRMKVERSPSSAPLTGDDFHAVEAVMRKQAIHLSKVIPAKERWQFGR